MNSWCFFFFVCLNHFEFCLLHQNILVLLVSRRWYYCGVPYITLLLVPRLSSPPVLPLTQGYVFPKVPCSVLSLFYDNFLLLHIVLNLYPGPIISPHKAAGDMQYKNKYVYFKISHIFSLKPVLLFYF